MSSEPAIRLRGVSKSYNIYNSPADRLKQMLWRGRRRFYNLFHALHATDVEVARGETLGIIGRNGSGKSTMLQIIAGTLEPSGGSVEVNGRVAALLELGTGFNPEFTGRENVFLNATILGLQQAEIEQRFDAIAAFADIGEFIERPVKTYSSGMYTRLAFAVAINADPDILIVDEALAVGDEAFQRKCYARINAIREAGATILFVSHSVGTILELCDRAMLLDHGERLYTGDPKQAVALYQKLMYAPAHELENARNYARSFDGKSLDTRQQVARTESPAAIEEGGGKTEQGEKATAPLIATSRLQDREPLFDPNLVSQSMVAYTELGARISDLVILDEDSRQVNILQRGRTYNVEYRVTFAEQCRNVHFSMLIKTISGLELGAQWSLPHSEVGTTAEAGDTCVVRFPFFLPFLAGTYFINAGMMGINGSGENVVLHRLVDAAMFRVQPVSGDRAERYVSILANETPTVRMIEASEAGVPARAGELSSDFHLFDNGVKLYRKHLLDVQVDRYAVENLHEPFEEKFFRQILDSLKGESDVRIADVGGGVGYYSILSKLVIPNATVYCFEPLADHAEAIEANLALNSVREGVNIIREGVSDTIGSSRFLELHYGSRLMSDDEADTSTPSVPTTTLAKLVSEASGPLDLVKVDVQGLELSVLKGAKPAFGSIRRWIIGTHGKDIHQACAAILTEAGYTLICNESSPHGQPDGVIVAA